MSNQDERKNALVGVDAAPMIRQAQREIAEGRRQILRQIEVDGPRAQTKLTLDCMSFKEPNGVFRLETIKEPFDGCGNIVVRERNERFLAAEMRWALVAKMVENRWCNEASARTQASNAVILIHGSV
jgi:hypothetical protein